MGQYLSRLRQQTGLSGIAPQGSSPPGGQGAHEDYSPGEPSGPSLENSSSGDLLSGEMSIVETPSMTVAPEQRVPQTLSQPPVANRPRPLSRDDASVNPPPGEIPTVEISTLEVPSQNSPLPSPLSTDDTSPQHPHARDPVVEIGESLSDQPLDARLIHQPVERAGPEQPVIQVSSASPTGLPRPTNRFGADPLRETEAEPSVPSSRMKPAVTPSAPEPKNYLQTLQAVRAWMADSVQGAISDDQAPPVLSPGELPLPGDAISGDAISGGVTAKGPSLEAIARARSVLPRDASAPLPVLPAQPPSQEDVPPVISIGSIQVTVEALSEPVAPPASPPPRPPSPARLSRHYIRLS